MFSYTAFTRAKKPSSMKISSSAAVMSGVTSSSICWIAGVESDSAMLKNTPTTFDRRSPESS